MRKRLCGHEQEFGMRVVPCFEEASGGMDFEDWRNQWVDIVIHGVADQPGVVHLPDFPHASRIWLGNGSFLHMDQGMVESSTAEYLACSLDGVLQEKATDKLLSAAITQIFAEQKIKNLTLYRNNAGPASDQYRIPEVTYGTHHNYSVLATKEEEVLRALQSFLPASIIFSGNGHVYEEDGKFHYALSQRSAHTLEIRQKGYVLIIQKDEPLIDSISGLRRIHIVSRDANRCEFQIWLVDAITHLVIRLVEEGWKLPEGYGLYRPLSHLGNINLSLENNLDYKMRCFDESSETFREIGLMDYNAIFLEAAKQLDPLSDDEKKALREWERVLGLLRARAFDKLVGELDWATKWFLLKRKMAQHNFGLNDFRAWRINMNYHNISPSPKESWFARLDEDGFIKHLVTEEEILKARFNTPPTRARSRAEFVKLCHQFPDILFEKRIVNMNWDSVGIKNFSDVDPLYTVVFGEPADPFSCESNSLKELRLALSLF